MKKTALIIFLTLSAVIGRAQSAYDAFLFSEDNYEGTARSVAMGNAFTALGGDLGAVGINPAGTAISRYSQIAFTPALTVYSNTASGVSPFADGSLPYFEKTYKNTQTAFSVPNFGMTFYWDTNRRSGLKSVSFGFVANRTNSWDENVYAAGRNNTTTFMGSMAANATANGYRGSELNQDNAYDYYNWRDVVGYHSGMISTFGGYDDQFVGASEIIYDNNGRTEIALGGPIDQTYGRTVRGSTYEYLFNLGFNISDFIYLGANLGISSMDYSYSEYFKEQAVDPADFEIGLDNGQTMYFSQMKYTYDYIVQTSGVFGKFGVIVTPGFGLRIGAAIQTPTSTTINERWQHTGETQYTEMKYDAYASSPQGEDRYSFRQPYKANFGIAYTLGQLGVISADYEYCDYSTMKFKRSGLNDGRDYFNDINAEIKNIFGASHTLRAGIEVKPFSVLAVRAGYNLKTSPEIYSAWGDKLPMLFSQNASFGLGYNSKGSFFADAACRYSFATDEYFMPYADYIFDGNEIASPAPEILNRKDAWKIFLTIGWRF